MVQQLLRDRGQTWQLAPLVLLIVVVTAVPFLGSLDNDFVNWDDGVYVKNNRQIQDLTWPSVQEIFSAPLSRAYTPFTLLSLSLDHAIWGLDPFGYHLTNLLLHLANTLLVFLFIWRLTNHRLPSLVAALLFGVHPLHVESVVWITERKDVLSTLFFLTALLCYLRFRREQRSVFYYVSLALFVIALLSKQMAITLPLVLLLCDFLVGRAWTRRVFVEKLPFFLLSLVFALEPYSFTISDGGRVPRLPGRLSPRNRRYTLLKKSWEIPRDPGVVRRWLESPRILPSSPTQGPETIFWSKLLAAFPRCFNQASPSSR